MNDFYEYFNSGIGKYRANPKENDTPDSDVSEYFRKKMNLKKKFSMPFFSLFILYCYWRFLDGNK
jgi:hypothetical protein